MGDAEEVLAGLGCRRAGAAAAGARAQRARPRPGRRSWGCGAIAIFGSATETFAQKNLNRSVTEQYAMFEPVVERALADGMWVRAYVSMCFGDPWEGPVPIDQVVDTAERLMDLGCAELSLGDTIGVGTTGHVHRLLEASGRKGHRHRPDRRALPRHLRPGARQHHGRAARRRVRRRRVDRRARRLPLRQVRHRQPRDRGPRLGPAPAPASRPESTSRRSSRPASGWPSSSAARARPTSCAPSPGPTDVASGSVEGRAGDAVHGPGPLPTLPRRSPAPVRRRPVGGGSGAASWRPSRSVTPIQTPWPLGHRLPQQGEGDDGVGRRDRRAGPRRLLRPTVVGGRLRGAQPRDEGGRAGLVDRRGRRGRDLRLGSGPALLGSGQRRRRRPGSRGPARSRARAAGRRARRGSADDTSTVGARRRSRSAARSRVASIASSTASSSERTYAAEFAYPGHAVLPRDVRHEVLEGLGNRGAARPSDGVEHVRRGPAGVEGAPHDSGVKR